jgi:hypothetical protein
MAKKVKVIESPELFPDGFTPFANGIRDHLRDGMFTPTEWCVYTTLHLWAEWGTGIYYGNAESLTPIWAGNLKQRTVRDCLYSLREKKYINYREGDGKRGPFNILINKFVCRKGTLTGWKLDAFADNNPDLTTPTYISPEGSGHGYQHSEGSDEPRVTKHH